MKIALYYSGMIRTMKKCYSSVFKLLKDHEVHVYLSIWDIPGHSLSGLANFKNIFPELKYKNINENLIRKEFPDINFKVIDIESFKKSKEIMSKYKHKTKTRLDIVSQSYKINRCNNFRIQYEKENNIKYDWYIRIRPDMFIKNLPNLNQIKKSTLLVNKYYDQVGRLSLETYFLNHNNVIDESICCNDHIWMTNDENIMNIMCNLYNNLSEYWDFNKKPILGNYMKTKDIIKNSQRYDFKVIILRSHGYCQVMGHIHTYTNNKIISKKHYYTKLI